MLRTELLHPEILGALGTSGHGSKVLIADGNYPFTTGSNDSAKKVYLNLAPGIVTVPQVLAAVSESIVIEAAAVMEPGTGEEPSIFEDFRSLLGEVELEKKGRFEFYEAARDQSVSLVISTGEERTYANILLTVGVVEAE
ncbi:MAG: RbsD/FucU family protein [Candidatus Bipolaricaulota bacterium]|nr:RbsD/FucU family protein [Candidatus Bipolaricaulota bacterium]MBS3791327.1 RbsD/FucU family protein [Candidatus Bipolaricaulota bacterium]